MQDCLHPTEEDITGHMVTPSGDGDRLCQRTTDQTIDQYLSSLPHMPA